MNTAYVIETRIRNRGHEKEDWIFGFGFKATIIRMMILLLKRYGYEPIYKLGIARSEPH